MIRVMSLIGILVLFAWVPKADARCPLSASNPMEVVDWDKLQALMPKVDSAVLEAIQNLLQSRVGGPVKIHRAIPADNRVVTTWTSCQKKNCRGGVMFTNSNPDKWRVLRRGIMPHNEKVGRKSRRAFRVTHSLLEDFDHDGDMELLVRYEVDGPRRPVTGIRTWEYIAMYNLPNLRAQLFYRVGVHGGGDLHKFCRWQLERKDVNCDGRTDLVVKQECGANKCFERDASERVCKGQPKKRKINFRWQKSNDTYATKKGFSRVTQVMDDRPYLVAAGSFAVAGTRYMKRAKALKKKLLKDGFRDAMIHNSREFAKLSCCYRVVVAGRFKTKAEAKKLHGKLRLKGYYPYLRKGF